MKMPDSKYEFGDICLIYREYTNTTYEDCPDCYDGSLNVVGPKGTTKVTCKTCNGSGHSYKIKSRSEPINEIVGMLEITEIHYEISKNPDNHWRPTGFRYQGKTAWKTDYDPKGWNTFQESKLEKI